MEYFQQKCVAVLPLHGAFLAKVYSGFAVRKCDHYMEQYSIFLVKKMAGLLLFIIG